MIIKLIQLPATNWLLIAQELNDPVTWDRFLPSHTADSDRYRFETMVRRTATNVSLTPRKEMLKAGVSVFEYDWNSEEDEILAHAMDVAGQLDSELIIGEQIKPVSAA